MSDTAVVAHAHAPQDHPPVALQIRGLTKTFTRANRQVIKPIDDVSLSIGKGEFTVLLGPSGCGKTTLLRCIAGLETPDAGIIEINGRRVVDMDARRKISVAPERRNLGMIFQSYALWPNKTVAQNVEYPLIAGKVPRALRGERVERALDIVGITDIAGQLPGRLSGGQQQRVSLARALVAESDLILFDEPLSNVDAKVREELRVQLVEMQQRIGFTAVYVTHDQIEALELADRIAVLDRGQIAQVGSPAQIYQRPATRHVATFVGSTNEITGIVCEVVESGLLVDVPGLSTSLHVPAPDGGVDVVVGDRVGVVWRPERTAFAGAPTATGLALEGTHVVSRHLGAYHLELIGLADGTEIRVMTQQAVPRTPHELVRIFVAEQDLQVYLLPR